jgi:hypothetical protein
MKCKMKANGSCARCGGRNASAWREAWSEALPGNATALVLNTGAWYSPFHLCGASVGATDGELDATLSLLLPLLAAWTARGVHVLWQDVPPMPDSGGRPEFAWEALPRRNAAARAALAAAAPDVTFLNTSAALGALRRLHPRLTSGGMHWCSPGPNSATQFVAARLLHAMARRCAEAAAAR